MDPTLIYGAGVAVTMAFLILARLIDWFRKLCHSPAITGWLFKFCYRQLWYHYRINSPTRLGIALQGLYWSGTIIYNIWGVRNMMDGSSRAIGLASLNIIPLLLVDKLESAANMFGVRIHTWRRFHGSVGLMTIVQTSIHVVLWSLQHGTNLRRAFDIYGITILASLMASLICTLPILKRRCFEVVSLAHLIFGTGAIYCLWRRLGMQLTQAHLFIMAACGCYVLSKCVRIICMLWKNFRLSHGWSKATVIKHSGAVRLSIASADSLNVKAGQYVYLWAPGVSLLSMFQSHPFAISWWSADGRGRTTSLDVTIKGHSGFTRRLCQLEGSTELLIMLDGPYGYCPDTSQYGTIILVASGIGIAAQTAVLRQVLNEYLACKSCVKRVSVIWQMDDEVEQQWVGDWMQTILDEDKDEIIRLQQYVTGGFLDKTTKYGEQTRYGKRGRMVYGAVEINEAIYEELLRAKGKAYIIVATETRLRNELRKISHSLDYKETDYIELDFQPQTRSHHFWRRRGKAPVETVINA